MESHSLYNHVRASRFVGWAYSPTNLAGRSEIAKSTITGYTVGEYAHPYVELVTLHLQV